MSDPLPPGARRCGSCGYTNVGPQQACLHCATALPAIDASLPGTVVTAAATPGVCASCGNPVGTGDAFCTTCGAPVG